jgi:large subunit ribosomal protein L29
MKATAQVQELRDMSTDELQAEAERLKESLFRSRFKLSLGQTDPLKNYRVDKKKLARIKTIMRERAKSVEQRA